MRKKLTVLILLFSTLTLWGNGVKINGIHYTLDNTSRTAYVTYTGDNIYATDYTGDIIIPDSVTYTLYDEVTYAVVGIASQAFFNASAVTSITMPAALRHIGDFAFRGCSGLTSLIIPDSVAAIGEQALRGCSAITTLTIPAAVRTIGTKAFQGATAIRTIICESVVPPVCNGDIFLTDEYANVTLIVPGMAVEAYRIAEGWKNFTFITSAVDQTGNDTDMSKDGKYFLNGQLIIIRDGRSYDAMGNEMR